MITHSDDITELAIELAKAMDKMGDAKKGSDNPFFKSKYADLNQFIDASKGILLQHGIVLTQHPATVFHAGDSQSPPTVLIGCETMLIHESGQWMRSTLLLPCLQLDPQKAGSAITYARRYTMQAILNMPARDDDGNDASKPVKPVKPVKQDNHSQQLFDTYSNCIGECKDEEEIKKYITTAFKETELDDKQKETLRNQATQRKEAINKGAK